MTVTKEIYEDYDYVKGSDGKSHKKVKGRYPYLKGVFFRVNNSCLSLIIWAFIHQAFCFLQLLLQEAYTLSQLLLTWEGIFDSDVIIRGHTHRSGNAFE